jgi:site-specific DNA-methyltransferase (adenine-specific)
MTRIILASTNPGAWVLDPFAGSSTTGIAANLIDRRFLGIERELEYVELSKSRRLELEDYHLRLRYRNKIKDIKLSEALTASYIVCEGLESNDLPF